MSSYGAAVAWGPSIADGRLAVRLTRRGRLLRSGILLLLVSLLVLLAIARVAGEPVLAGSEASVVPTTTVTVVIEQGDSLWEIARRVAPGADPRDVVHRIRELNGLRSNLIQPGQVLLVPAR